MVHAIYPRSKDLVKGEAGQRVAKSMPFASVTIEANSKHVLRELGYEEFPCIVSRFKKLPSSHYGIGIMALALPDAITANQIMKMSLQAVELNLRWFMDFSKRWRNQPCNITYQTKRYHPSQYSRQHQTLRHWISNSRLRT